MDARTLMHSKCKRPGAMICCLARAPNWLMLMNPGSWEHGMDDLILEATICQDEHWANQSASLKVKLSGDLSKGCCKRLFYSALIAIMSYPCLPRTIPCLPHHDVLIPPVRGTLRDLARVMGWGINHLSVSCGEAEGHCPGISRRTAWPGSVQIRVEGPNGAAVCTECSHECVVSKSYIRGWTAPWTARAYRDGHGRNTQINELRHMAIRLLHVRSFSRIQRSKESWPRMTVLCCIFLVCRVENVSAEI
jgi:hypothetical protein